LVALSGPGCGGADKHAKSAANEADRPLDMDVPPEPDRSKLAQAVRSMDDGTPERAIGVLKDIRSRHPENGIVLHELALAYRMVSRPEKTVEVLMPYRRRIEAVTLANLGSALDELGRRAEAEAVLRDGLKRFPRSGLLHSELATTLGNAGKFDQALELYQRGIEVEPDVPANYLHLARITAASDHRGLALVFGETFRLLEPGSPRSAEMAKLMVRVCDEAVELDKGGPGKDANGKVMLAPTLVIERAEQMQKMPLVNVIELAFGPGLLLAHRDGLSLASLHRARVAFVDVMNKPDSPLDWNAVPVFRWIREVSRAGHLEAYDYWLYGPAFPEEMTKWAKANPTAMDEMIRYATKHPLFPGRQH
jgi:tetratricopeptide (TPR) repeat protein